MSLRAVVVCADEKVVRVLRRVLSDLEIAVETCRDAEEAVQKLTRQRFEAVIVDCDEERTASQVLRSARSAPCNKRAVAVALIDGQKPVVGAFNLGAHFVLYKPISMERAKSSFRAVRALMKRERRRNTRVPVEIPVTFVSEDGSSKQKTDTSDVSEGGMAVRLLRQSKKAGAMQAEFTLPGTRNQIRCSVEVAWENPGRQTGVRFIDLSAENSEQLKAWLNSQSPEMERDDPPVDCKLTDLSLGGCYLEMVSPFPVRTRVVLSMHAGGLQVKVEGVVRVMHPEAGMGVEFRQTTTQQKERVEKFIQSLMKGGASPELFVEPEGLEAEGEPASVPAAGEEVEDPLIELFHNKSELSVEEFRIELGKQRHTPQDPKTPTSV